MKNHRYFTEQLGCKSRWSALIKIMEVNDILHKHERSVQLDNE